MMELRNWILGVIDDLEDAGRPDQRLYDVVAKIDEIMARKEAKEHEQSTDASR